MENPHPQPIYTSSLTSPATFFTLTSAVFTVRIHACPRGEAESRGMSLQDLAHQYDVAVLGEWLVRLMLACILAKRGVRVILMTRERIRVSPLESRRFHTRLYSLLCWRKNTMSPNWKISLVPRESLSAFVLPAASKRTFAYHRPGKTFDPKEGHQLGTSSKDESHFFRQDIDAYLFHAAVHDGASPHQKTKVTDIAIHDRGVTIKTTTGEEILARYVVDGTGHDSLLAARFDLRENPSPLKHHSRTRQPSGRRSIL